MTFFRGVHAWHTPLVVVAEETEHQEEYLHPEADQPPAERAAEGVHRMLPRRTEVALEGRTCLTLRSA